MVHLGSGADLNHSLNMGDVTIDKIILPVAKKVLDSNARERKRGNAKGVRMSGTLNRDFGPKLVSDFLTPFHSLCAG